MSAKKQTGTINSDSDNAVSEIRIAVSDVAREITIQSALAQTEILDRVNKALSANAAVVFDDVRGRQFLIPAQKIGVIEIGDATERKVGFTNS